MKKYFKLNALILVVFLFNIAFISNSYATDKQYKSYYQKNDSPIVNFDKKIAKRVNDPFSYSLQTGKRGDLLLTWKGNLDREEIKKAQLIIKKFNLPIGFFWIKK